MKAFFLDILNKHAPVTKIKVKGISLPYVTSELRTLFKTRDYLRAKANKTGSECLWQAFNHTRNKVNKLLSDLQKYNYSKKIEEKSGDKDDLNNYRPITLLPTKLVERLLYDQMYTYLAEQGRQNSRGRGGTFWPISIFIYRKSIEVFYSLMSILI